MKKIYNSPDIRVVRINEKDIIITSDGEIDVGGTDVGVQLPEIPGWMDD